MVDWYEQELKDRIDSLIAEHDEALRELSEKDAYAIGEYERAEAAEAEVARMKAMVVELCTDERGVCSIRAALAPKDNNVSD